MKIQEFNDVGIKNLNDLTKEELIYCIKGALELDRSAKFWFERRLIEVADKRRRKKIDEDEAKGKAYIDAVKEYEKLLEPYKGMKIGELPPEVVQKGAELERKAKKAWEAYSATFGQGYA